jgi:deoxycytidylate deaminase
MRIAMRYARIFSEDAVMPNASVICSKARKPIASGANGSEYHRKFGCIRQAANSATGQDYDLCEGCQPQNHSERRALAHAQKRDRITDGCDLYLWGHFGCCPPCWDSMIGAGIDQVYLLEDAEFLFNKEHPDNVIGRQFQYFRSYF